MNKVLKIIPIIIIIVGVNIIIVIIIITAIIHGVQTILYAYICIRSV